MRQETSFFGKLENKLLRPNSRNYVLKNGEKAKKNQDNLIQSKLKQKKYPGLKNTFSHI